MQQNRAYYNKMIDTFTFCIDKMFGSNMEKIKITRFFEHLGGFKLEYVYLPNNYKIIIENEISTFFINIIDAEEAFNSLNAITIYKYQTNHYSFKLTAECIENAVALLKDVLDENNIPFYFTKNGELYKKNKECIKKIKEIYKD